MSAVPAVSVLLSVRNGLPYVPQTIASICTQTFTDFEFVIVDNLSSDGTREILEASAKSDHRIRLLLNERDLGHSGGLNRGLSECRAAWVARIDADDVALPTRLERQIAFVKEQPSVSVASCLAYYIDGAGRRIGKTFHDLRSGEDFARYMAANEMIGVLHPGAFMDRQLVDRMGGYRQPYGGANDIDLWARVAETGRPILVQQEYLMEYRIHPAQGTAKFMENRMRYEWARASALARRRGETEPDWDEFMAVWNKAGWARRLNRSRKIYAKYFYHAAGLDFACGRRLRAVANFAGAALLQPGYALGRLAGQRLTRS